AVVGAYDPNDKQAEPATMSPAEVMTGERITYTIRFQNTGNYPAERVLITDTLESGLQWNSLRPIAASHAHHWYLHNGVLHVLFENINLPDSTSDEPGSHGFFRFSMTPQPTLPAGELVHNSANIYFDFNEPVITNDAVFTVDINTGLSAAVGPSLSVWPQPFDERLTITGALNGASIRLYDAVGRMVTSTQSTSNMLELSTSDLGPGLYLLSVAGNGSGTVLRTLIKQ
ncbi:MAG: T9SS type A sorting domain-containing protein, partial [Flavobacteriales bacterium]|nr:T9SS type A sorting domain-containing protein [Flavobacteriales bacterium]